MVGWDVAEVEAPLRAGAALDAIRTSSRQWERKHCRPPTLTAREALTALEHEALLVCVAAGNIAHGVELSDDDRARLFAAYRMIDTLLQEFAR